MQRLLKRRDFAEKALLVSILILLVLAIVQHIFGNGHSFSR